MQIRLQQKAVKSEPICTEDLRHGNAHEALVGASLQIQIAVQQLLDECRHDNATPERITVQWINKTNLDPSDPDYNPAGYIGHFLVTGQRWSSNAVSRPVVGGETIQTLLTA